MHALSNKVTVIRKAHFCAAHRLINPNKSEEWNTQTYGLCSLPNYHGHNYEIEVAVSGTPNLETGMVIDLKLLATIIEDEITSKCDHKNLNLDLPYFKDVIPSTENLAIFCWKQLCDKIPAGTLELIRIYETPRNFVEFRG